MGRKGQEIEGKQSAERDVESNDDMWRVQAHSKLGIARSVHLAGFTSPREVKEGNNTDTELICVFTGEAVRTLGFQFIILDALISLNTTYEIALSITYTCCASNELAGTAQTSLVGKKKCKSYKVPTWAWTQAGCQRHQKFIFRQLTQFYTWKPSTCNFTPGLLVHSPVSFVTM